MISPESPHSGPNQTAISIVLPVAREEHALADALEAYAEVLEELGREWEILLVPEAEGIPSATYHRAKSIHASIREWPPAVGWGAAVRAGLEASVGDVLCYTNWRRTAPAALAEMLALAARNPAVVLRANRRTRDTRVQRIGSLLFNLQCRFMLQVPAWDINGTPKIFPRAFGRLLELTCDDGLLDAEFALVCERSEYPVVEVPVGAELLSGAGSAGPLDLPAALRMYAGVFKLRVMREGSR
jgi:hypothetical protein